MITSGAAVGAVCIKCGIGMSCWTTVNGHPCCDWCRPPAADRSDSEARLKAFEKIAPDVLERLKAHSSNSHLGSESERVYLAFYGVVHSKGRSNGDE